MYIYIYTCTYLCTCICVFFFATIIRLHLPYSSVFGLVLCFVTVQKLFALSLSSACANKSDSMIRKRVAALRAFVLAPCPCRCFVMVVMVASIIRVSCFRWVFYTACKVAGFNYQQLKPQ